MTALEQIKYIYKLPEILLGKWWVENSELNRKHSTIPFTRWFGGSMPFVEVDLIAWFNDSKRLPCLTHDEKRAADQDDLVMQFGCLHGILDAYLNLGMAVNAAWFNIQICEACVQLADCSPSSIGSFHEMKSSGIVS